MAGSREVAKRAACQSNLKQISVALQLYVDNNDSTLPDAGFYGCGGKVGEQLYQAILGTQEPEDSRPLNAYLQNTGIFRCPADKGDTYPGFRSNSYFQAHGSSYTYASDGAFPDGGGSPTPVPTFGIGSCRSLKTHRLQAPTKKVVFLEPPFSPLFNEFTVDIDGDGSTRNNARAWWHDKRRNHGNLIFADQHVQFTYTTVFEYFAVPDPDVGYY
jgi:hypothetical protein